MAGAYDDRDGKIWMDGKLVEWRDAKVHILTHALHYASSVFEGSGATTARSSRGTNTRCACAARRSFWTWKFPTPPKNSTSPRMRC